MIRSHEELDVYRLAFKAAMRVYVMTKSFPRDETYSLIDQIRRSSRSVCSNIAEAWRKRRYEASFVSCMNNSEAEAVETQVWLRFAIQCGYLQENAGNEIYALYDQILGKIVSMIARPQPWIMPRLRNSPPHLSSSAPLHPKWGKR